MASWPGVIRVVLNWSRLYGDPMVNVLHVERDPNTSPPNATEIDAVLAATRDNLWDKAGVGSDLRNFMDDDTTLTTIVGTSVDSANYGTQRSLAVNQIGNGSAGSNEVSPQLAVVCSHSTALATRRTRGRTYLGGFNQGQLSQSAAGYPVLGSQPQIDLTTAWTQWRTALAALTVPYFHVIASIAGQDTSFVTTTTVRTLLYTQRRRGPHGSSY